MNKILVINSGSSTLKFKIYLMPSEKMIASGLLERIGLSDSIITIKYDNNKVYKETKKLDDHAYAIKTMLSLLKTLNIVDDLNEIKGIGHRVVAGGEYFDKPVIIDQDVMKKIAELSELAPLHNPNNLIGIKEFKKLLPNATAVAVFDTAFHQTMPEENYIYSTPYEWYEQYGARRYGAHGTSHEYVANEAAKYIGKPLEKLKIITCHLGAGASICAVKNGKSFDTSMGFTPLAGLTMATRSGDVDFSLVSYIMDKMDISDVNDALKILNKKSGLLGISGISSDARDIEKAEHDGNSRAILALNIFVRNVVRYIGQYYAEMAGLDAIVFTAGIGENSVEIREKIINRLSFMGINLDNEKNSTNRDIIISKPQSKIYALRIPTNEELVIARDVEKLRK